tara:strand:+ start:146 stop:508 length:363 start_codon:yes stop_codon:yes gene_type:complete
MAVNATISTERTVQADLTQSTNNQVVRVTVPGTKHVGSFSQDRDQKVNRISVPGLQGPTGPQGPAGADGSGVLGINTSNDVDVSAIADGALLQYKSSNSKWTATNDISNIGLVTINGGNF